LQVQQPHFSLFLAKQPVTPPSGLSLSTSKHGKLVLVLRTGGFSFLIFSQLPSLPPKRSPFPLPLFLAAIFSRLGPSSPNGVPELRPTVAFPYPLFSPHYQIIPFISPPTTIGTANRRFPANQFPVLVAPNLCCVLGFSLSFFRFPYVALIKRVSMLPPKPPSPPLPLLVPLFPPPPLCHSVLNGLLLTGQGHFRGYLFSCPQTPP